MLCAPITNLRVGLYQTDQILASLKPANIQNEGVLDPISRGQVLSRLALISGIKFASRRFIGDSNLVGVNFVTLG